MGKPRECEQTRDERRESYRVSDVLSTVCRKIDPAVPHLGARILPGFTEDCTLPQGGEEPPDESVNPHLWKMLLQINNRLGMILDRQNLEAEGIAKAEPREVSISTGGASFATQEKYEVGDQLEVKILLPLDPPQWIVVYGEVLRQNPKEKDLKDVALRFTEMDEEVMEAIGRYCLKRQREVIRKRRDS